jgi:hypothetical protein
LLLDEFELFSVPPELEGVDGVEGIAVVFE